MRKKGASAEARPSSSTASSETSCLTVLQSCDIMVSMNDRIMSSNSVLQRRLLRNWSQAELAQRAGVSRSAVSAIEGNRLAPSVQTALALAAVFECSVEELFGEGQCCQCGEPVWAWTLRKESSRYWEAQVGQRQLLYPVEASSLNSIPHDGFCENQNSHHRDAAPATRTLVVATCDPAAGILAMEYARITGFRMLVFSRGGAAALQLLREGLVHVAALHRSTQENPGRNAQTVRERLGKEFQLLRVADWEEGMALPPQNAGRCSGSMARHIKCWAAREPGSGARECLEQLLEGHPWRGREVNGHTSVAEAVRSGWAEAGICVRLSAAEAGLNFRPVRKESLDFCFANQSQRDPRVQALIRLLRSRSFCQLVSELPGYDSRHTGEITVL